MKRLIIATIAVFAVALSANSQRIKGSDTVLPVSQKEAEDYKKTNKSSSVSVTSGGNGVGISALLAGTTDIAQASRRIKFDERQKMKEVGKTVKELIIAYDALAVVVHPYNKDGKLTRKQLERIFIGKSKTGKKLASKT